MFWLNFKRIFRAGFINFFRNAFVSLSAVLIMSIALFVISITIFSNASLQSSLEGIKQKVDVNVYFLPTVSEEAVLGIKREIESLPEVEEVEYVSREQALENFEFRHRNDEEILEALNELDENPLGAILNVKAKETSQYESVALFLDQNYPVDLPESIIDTVNYNQNKEVIDRLNEIITKEERKDFFTIILFNLIAIIITFNTIRLTIYISRDEVRVMKLVGASNSYVTGPFVVTGVFYGLISSFVVLALLYVLTYYDSPILYGSVVESLFDEFSLFGYYLSNFFEIALILIASGVLIGAISSYIAVKKYLKVYRKK